MKKNRKSVIYVVDVTQEAVRHFRWILWMFMMEPTKTARGFGEKGAFLHAAFVVKDFFVTYSLS